jgi:hypothetical protein
MRICTPLPAEACRNFVAADVSWRKLRKRVELLLCGHHVLKNSLSIVQIDKSKFLQRPAVRVWFCPP